jgi:membrane-bound lytic murein transglycosylase MltF
VSVRTGLTRGYDYKETPPAPTADFFDPGYLTQSTGFVYNRVKGFTTRLGIALQEVFADKFDTLYNKETKTGEVKKILVDTGLESVTTAEYSFAENLLYKGNLRLFTRFNSLDVWDIRWENEVVAKINNFLNVNVTYLFLYEKAQSPTAQMKESLQLGFVLRIL